MPAAAVDPWSGAGIYVGTDLGVYRSFDGGFTWTEMNEGMPPAMVLDLTIRPADRRLRASTYGNGVYEAALADPSSVEDAPAAAESGIRLEAPSPNPVRESAVLRYSLPRGGPVRLKIHDGTGKVVRVLSPGERPAGAGTMVWDARDEEGRPVGRGVYFARLEVVGGGSSAARKIVVME